MYKFKPYLGIRVPLSLYVAYCYNKFGYDMGLMLRTKDKSSQKIYYEKGDKYGQKGLMYSDLYDPVYLYNSNGTRDKITLKKFYELANDGDTILKNEFIIDHDFEHQEIDFKDKNNPLFKILMKLDIMGLKYQVYGTIKGRAIKIKFKMPGYNEKYKIQQLSNKIIKNIGGELKLSGHMCGLCYPALIGSEPIHTKTGLRVKLLHES